MNSSPKKAHFIGICGVGMSATAKLLMEKGWQISGSDEGFYPPLSTYLREQHIPCTPHYSKDNIPPDADMIVIGKHAKLLPEENEEVKAAFESGIPIKSFPDVLGELTRDTYNFVIVGSYGKSTCTALTAFCLKDAGKDPSYFIGAVPLDLKQTSAIGKGRYFVLEGDEYPASNWDKRSKFLSYNPTEVLLTSGEHDHVNIFPTVADYVDPYKQLVKMLSNKNRLIACTDAENVKEIAAETKAEVITYSLHGSTDDKAGGTDWMAANIKYGTITTFDLVHKDKKVVTIETELIGRHNIENIVGVGALLLSGKHIGAEEFAAAVRKFHGIKRRLDKKTAASTVTVYEAFGTSYKKARSSFEAIRLHYPKNRIVTIFEPHTFSWRNKEAIHWYDDVFAESDLIIVYEPPQHGAKSHHQSSLEEIVDRVKNAGKHAYGIHDKKEAFIILEKELAGQDVVILMTSGDLGGLIEATPPFFEQKFPL